MLKRMTTCSAICFLAALLFHTDATAQWSIQYGVVVDTPDTQGSPAFVPDGEGGVVVVWSKEVGGESDIHAQHYDDHGVAQGWPWGQVCSFAGDQAQPRIATDGAGGYFITWEDERAGGAGIYGQRLSAEGVAQWDAGGIPIAWDPAPQGNHEMAYDGFGALIVVWDQLEFSYYDIRAQRVGTDGTLLWGDEVLAASTTGHMRYPDLAILPGPSESETRFTIVWFDFRDSPVNGSDIFAQRMTLGGVVQFAADGAEIYAGPYDQIYPDLVASVSASTIISWRDQRNGDDWGYCQRIDRYGSRLWTGSGLQLAETSTLDQEGPKMVSDGTYGAFVAGGNEVYRLDQNGSAVWNETIHTGAEEEAYNMYPVRLDDGSCVVVNSIYPDSFEPERIAAHKLDWATGYKSWGYFGVPVSEQVTDARPLTAVVSGEGVYAVWDWVDFQWIVTLQRLDLNEVYRGYPRPVIVEVADVPLDEGGWLTMTVRAPSNDDPFGIEDPATGYNIWRRVDAAASGSAAVAEDVLAEISAKNDTAGLCVSGEDAMRLGLPVGDWESLGFHGALQEPYYDFIVPTRTDATDGSEPYEILVVTVHTTTPTTHFTSLPDSAYSVDNLAPGQLAGLTGAASFEPESLELAWEPNTASDLAVYHVHRSTDADFGPSGSNRVATPMSTIWLDPDWTADSDFVYKVAAVDRHGNVGEYATLLPDGVTGLTDLPPSPPALDQNYPNPFNAKTSLRFTLGKPAAATLRIYDTAGRLVETLIDKEPLGPGVHVRTWDGTDQQGRIRSSGIYIGRLEMGVHRYAVRMMLVK